VRADWVACAIGLARELLGADLRSEFNGRNANVPVVLSARREHLPRWLGARSVAEMGPRVSPNHRVQDWSSLVSRDGGWKQLAGYFFGVCINPCEPRRSGGSV